MMVEYYLLVPLCVVDVQMHAAHRLPELGTAMEGRSRNGK